MPSPVLRTLHVFIHLISLKYEETIPWEKEIKLFILTSESKNIIVGGSLQVTEFTFLFIDEESEFQRSDMASLHPFC